MKKVILVISIVVIIIISCISIYIIKSKQSAPAIKTEKIEYNSEGIKQVVTLEDKIESDAIWCGSFQLIWNDLKNDLAKQDIIFNPQKEVIENLNKETFTINDISENSYYKKIGNPSLELKKQIEQEIKEKFNETSDILDDFDWSNKSSDDYFLYVMLKKKFEFNKAFEELENSKFGIYDNVKYFGIKGSKTSSEVRNQVEVLYYTSEEDFAIKLKTKQEDEVILCKNPVGDTFNEIFENIKNNNEKYTGIKTLKEGELLKIPNINIKQKSEITEVENESFYFSDGREYQIEKAIQTIQFELNKDGGKVKSEAGMMLSKSSAFLEDERRLFYLDDTFAIFLIEKDKEKPYLAAKINDITKFQSNN